MTGRQGGAVALRIPHESSALVVVDMQNGFCHPQGTVGSTMSVEAHREIIPRVAELVAAAHAAGLPVVWSRQEHRRDDVSINRSRLDNPQIRVGDPACLQGSWDAELIDELVQLVDADDIVVVKRRASAFYGTSLEVELRMRAIRTLVFTGVSTSYCVDASVRDAYARDLSVVLVEDACASPWPDLHEATMKNAALFHGTVTVTSRVVAELAAERVDSARPA